MNVTTSLPLEPDNEGSVHVRTLFISDVHLGTRGCQAEKLLAFLRYYEADTIFLVGDIVDGWALKSTWYWPQAHNDVVQKLLRKARKGARMIYMGQDSDGHFLSIACHAERPLPNARRQINRRTQRQQERLEARVLRRDSEG